MSHSSSIVSVAAQEVILQSRTEEPSGMGKFKFSSMNFFIYFDQDLNSDWSRFTFHCSDAMLEHPLENKRGDQYYTSALLLHGHLPTWGDVILKPLDGDNRLLLRCMLVSQCSLIREPSNPQIGKAQ